jgi:hypothetical protein
MRQGIQNHKILSTEGISANNVCGLTRKAVNFVLQWRKLCISAFVTRLLRGYNVRFNSRLRTSG